MALEVVPSSGENTGRNEGVYWLSALGEMNLYAGPSNPESLKGGE